MSKLNWFTVIVVGLALTYCTGDMVVHLPMWN